MDGGLHGRGWCKGFMCVWDKRFLILNSGWDCSGYSAAYDCSSGADDRMALQAGGVSLTRWGQKSFLWWSRVRLKAGHIDVLQMEYALLWRIRFALCKYDIVQYFGASALVWAVEMFFIHISSACVHSVYRCFCACLQGLDIKNGKLGHERLKTGLEHITSVIWWDKLWSLWCHSNSFSIQEEVVRDYIWR